MKKPQSPLARLNACSPTTPTANGDPLIISGVRSLSNGNGTASFNAATNYRDVHADDGLHGTCKFQLFDFGRPRRFGLGHSSLNVTAPPATQGLFSTSDTPAVTRRIRNSSRWASSSRLRSQGMISGIGLLQGHGRHRHEYCGPVEFDGHELARQPLATRVQRLADGIFLSGDDYRRHHLCCILLRPGLIRPRTTTSRPADTNGSLTASY